jgi:hypothetical protein
MIGLHCHFLPSIDDGAATLEESLALTCAAVVNRIIHASLNISTGAVVRIGPELIELLEEDVAPFAGQFGLDKVVSGIAPRQRPCRFRLPGQLAARAGYVL